MERRSLGANKYRFWAGAGKTKRVRDEEQATGAGCRDPVEPIKIPIMSRRGVRKGAEGACGEEEEQEVLILLKLVSYPSKIGSCRKSVSDIYSVSVPQKI